MQLPLITCIKKHQGYIIVHLYRYKHRCAIFTILAMVWDLVNDEGASRRRRKRYVPATPTPQHRPTPGTIQSSTDTGVKRAASQPPKLDHQHTLHKYTHIHTHTHTHRQAILSWCVPTMCMALSTTMGHYLSWRDSRN